MKEPKSPHRAIEPAEWQITCVWRVAQVPGSILRRLTKHPGLPSGHVDDGQHGKAASPVPLSVEVPFLAVGQQLLEVDPPSIGRDPDFADILVLHHQFGSERLRCRRRSPRHSCETRTQEADESITTGTPK